MKCSKCGSEWSVENISVEIKTCPFCGNAVAQKPKENATVKAALRWLVEDREISVFQNSALVNSVLADLVPKEETERNKIRLSFSAGAGAMFYKLLSRGNGKFREAEINEFQRKMADQGFTPDFTSFVLNTFLYAVNLPEIAVSQSEGKTAPKRKSSATSTKKSSAQKKEKTETKKKNNATVSSVAAPKNKKPESVEDLYKSGHNYIWTASAYAMKLISPAAAQGNPDAQADLGIMYYQGLGVTKDNAEALKYFKLAADQGNPMAQMYLGDMYSLGDGVARNMTEAWKWYEKSSALRYGPAMFRIGYLFEIGQGTKCDIESAKAWYKKGAAAGDKESLKRLLSLQKGKTTNPAKENVTSEQKRTVTSVKYDTAPEKKQTGSKGNSTASASHAVAIHREKSENIDDLYKKGHSYIESDPVYAMKLIRPAADQGNPEAQADLGIMYLHGRGVVTDAAEAAKWFELAANQGNSEAQLYLADMYKTGTGVEKNIAEAWKWYKKSAGELQKKHGYKESLKRILGLQKQ